MSIYVTMPGYWVVHLLTMWTDLQLLGITGELGDRRFNTIQFTDLPVDIGPGQVGGIDEHSGINEPPHNELDYQLSNTLLDEMDYPGMTKDMRGDIFLVISDR